MRLAIAGIHIESSTFSPLPSELADFHATRGTEMLARYPFLAKAEFSDITPVPLAHFRALPGGPVRREAYDAMKAEILEHLDAAGRVEALYYDVHGAMTVEGLLDAELDLLLALKRRLPRGTPVTCSQDLHGNLSAELVAEVDLITAYRTAPHVDVLETRERAVRLLQRWLGERRPLHRAWVGIPVLVSGEMSSTESEPGRSLYAPLPAESGIPGVWDASLWIGYAWADQPRSRAAVVVTGTEEEAVRRTAKGIAARVWRARRDFRFIAPTGSAEECLREALRLGGPAVFCSDAGDNPTAGAAGDVPATLKTLVGHPAFAAGGTASALFASIADAGAVATCAAAGMGSTVHLRLGGKLDPVHGEPLPLSGVVERLSPDGQPTTAVLRAGNVRVIVTTRRTPFHKRADFLALGLDPLEHTVTVVKIGYLEPELKAMARHHLLVLSPGAVHPLISALPYPAVARPIFPLDGDFDWDAVARLFASAPPGTDAAT